MEPLREAGVQLNARDVTRLQEEQNKVLNGCQEKIQHWKKVEGDYDALQERLGTLPDKLSYNIMVPFGPLAFMPGRLVKTNEVNVLLGDNWFAKCSAKQARTLVDHRKKHVRKALEDLQKVMENFESRVELTRDLAQMTNESSDFLDIKEDVSEETVSVKGKHRTAHKPHSKPKAHASSSIDFREAEPTDRFLDNAELWARLEELERQEEQQGELSEFTEARFLGNNPRSEEDKENQSATLSFTEDAANPARESILNSSHVNGSLRADSDDEDDPASFSNSVATIHFSHTVEPKRVRINTGKNTTLKYSERKEEAKRKRKNSNGNGHSHLDLPVIKTPADIYRAFVDVVNGEYIPRKSIMKSRSRENSVCSDTSENSSHEMEERRGYLRNLSMEDCIFSDHSEDDDYRTHKKLSPIFGPPEAFSGTVIEKEPFSISVPMTSMAHPALPTIEERRAEEVAPDSPEEGTKRVSKFKAARMQQNK
ncbi:unconventional prefoldin RPB5 interactor 1 [Hyperolius riggenbachi]|uniref:unconventional prefoldin RPB5 interactor 1 n=1 Tax=Hyperolius riggenbachi TaxID=752182 RepID=UPI0035A36C05